ncbi:methyltransferase [Undibacterium sp.]|jgi:SAM-dependent methyltransferase|uniref:methyltransferase n=1 Tax=Undibacterium sp. TaxID=1914977 RepID=UPI002BCFF569|nr:methyltransferase [Undibacterium sp.]HTD04952.1 methyltransferase [Undibacterium sp.]
MDPFETRDPTASQFWDERFKREFTPWDKGGVPQALQDFVKKSARPLATLIPGCGAAHEAVFLAEAGWDVTAIDFSPAAVATAKAAAGKWADRIVEADFFQFRPARTLDLIYERAFLCALPARMRPDVAARWAGLLPAGGMLAGYFFFDNDPKGPPFGMLEEELNDLLDPLFELLEDAAVQDSIPVFQGKERWKVWRRR